MAKGRISEIFSSVQGEGLYAGARQVFVRFFGCNLTACRFCDTTLSEYSEYDTHQLLSELIKFKENYRSVSITGGEPLLQKVFLREFLPLLNAAGKTVYLETNGTLPEELKAVLEFTDIIAMDFKSPSSTGLGEFWQVHEEFLRIARVKKVFVKAVITATTERGDIERIRDIIAGVSKRIVLVLQPVTPTPEVCAPGEELLKDFRNICLDKLRRVKIIPQTHKAMGVK